MSASLVGSEMCIRDRTTQARRRRCPSSAGRQRRRAGRGSGTALRQYCAGRAHEVAHPGRTDLRPQI
eukprot:10241749-Alexandrium_andersonii.AAC.1